MPIIQKKEANIFRHNATALMTGLLLIIAICTNAHAVTTHLPTDPEKALFETVRKCTERKPGTGCGRNPKTQTSRRISLTTWEAGLLRHTITAPEIKPKLFRRSFQSRTTKPF